MNSPKEHRIRQDSIKLIVIGLGFIHPEGGTAQHVPLAVLHAIALQRLGINNEELIAALADLKEDGIIVNGELPDSDGHFGVAAQHLSRVVPFSDAPLDDVNSPFHRFVHLASSGLLQEYGITAHSAPRLMAPPFPNAPIWSHTQQGYRPPHPAGGYQAQHGQSQMHHGARFTPPSFGQQPGIGGFYPHQPIGSERETYSDEPAIAVDAPVVHRTTMIKGVEMLPDDVKLLLYKLNILVGALANVPPLNDKDFMITATFKGLEFTIPEAFEILQTLS